MLKKYDYHSGAGQLQILLPILWIGLLLIYIPIFADKKLPLSDVIPMRLMFALGIGVSFVAYKNIKSTYIEIRDEGLFYHSWRKKITAPWDSVREIKIQGRKHKIYTDSGNFSIGYLEPADAPRKSFIGIVKNQGEYSEEVIDEIKKQARNAKITYSIFLRPL